MTRESKVFLRKLWANRVVLCATHLTINNDSPHSTAVHDRGTCVMLKSCPRTGRQNTALTGVRAETQEEVKMKKNVFLSALAAAAVTATGALADGHGGATLAAVKDRGSLKCGISTGLVGFASQDANDEWEGFDVAVCRAVAAAVLGDPTAVEFRPVTNKERFEVLNSGDIDMLSRNTTWTFSRDVDLKLEFVGVNYYDGQGFMVPKELGVSSAKDLDGAPVCIQSGTTTELNLADFFRTNNISYQPVSITTASEAQQAYLAGRCAVYTTDASGLAATRASFENPEDHVVLPEIISKEPLGPLVRHGDSEWGDVVRWSLNTLIAAEELGITSANVGELSAAPTENPEINRLLGTEGNLGEMLGLPTDFGAAIIQADGNYGEIFEKYIGENTPIGLSRGLNAQWTDGGLLYAPPFR